MSERTLCRSKLMGNDAIAHALGFYKAMDRCNLHGNVDVITLPAGTACTLERCYLEDVNIETPTPHLIKTIDCQLDRSAIRQSFVAPQGAYFLRQFGDDIARVQLIGGGSVKTVTFEGPNAEARALEYQAWANEKLAATVCPTKEEAKEQPSWSRSGPAREIDIRRRGNTPMVALVEELENIGLIPVIESKSELTDSRLADAAIGYLVQHRSQQVCVCRKCRNSPCTCV